VPLTALLPPRLLTKQFTQTFTWGGQYLQPSSRVLGLLTLFTSFLTARLPDAVEAGRWSVWVGLFCLLVTIAPYEIYLIFPINDRVTEIGEALDKGENWYAGCCWGCGDCVGDWEVGLKGGSRG
jgi:hypothetical protein